MNSMSGPFNIANLSIAQWSSLITSCEIGDEMSMPDDHKAYLCVNHRKLEVRLIEHADESPISIDIHEISSVFALLSTKATTVEEVTSLYSSMETFRYTVIKTIDKFGPHYVSQEDRNFPLECNTQLNDYRKKIFHAIIDDDQGRMEKFIKIVLENPSLLFESKNEEESIFDELMKAIPRNEGLVIVEAILLNLDNLNLKESQTLKDYLFSYNPLYEKTQFESLMSRSNGNKSFDKLLKILDPDELNRNSAWKDQVIKFAFGKKRYEALFIQDTDFSPEEMDKLKSVTDSLKIPASTDTKMLDEKRMGTCNTIADPSKGRQRAIQNWKEADQYMRSNLHVKLSLIHIKELNRIMTNQEEGVEDPGVSRDVTKKIVRMGGLWTQLLCPPDQLKIQLSNLDSWLEKEQVRCDAKEKNPILLAAQLNQRLITLHIFENGNGRTTKLAIDWILMRYGFPSPIMSKSFDGVSFNLQPTNKKADYTVEEIIKGLDASHAYIRGDGL